jgi:hypothetical protein
MMKDALGDEGFYCVFVDDFRAVSTDKRLLERLAVKARSYLWQYLGLRMHRRKFSIIDAKKGVPFIGAIIMPWGIYASNRIVNNAFEVAQIEHVDDMERHVQRLNSYMGFLGHRLTYAIRRNLYDAIPTDIKRRMVCINMKKFVLRRQQACSSSERRMAC